MDIEEERKTRYNGRKAAKSAVTRKENEILDEMSRFEDSDLLRVKVKVKELADSIGRFKQQHADFHALITDDTELKASEDYYDDVEEKYQHILDKVKNYEQSMERKLSDAAEIKLGESAGGAGSSRSGKSHRSSVSSARVKASAKKAALKAEMAALSQQRQLEQEELQLKQKELQLKQKKEKLRLETEMAKTEAEETVLAEAEGTSVHSQLPAGGSTVPKKTSTSDPHHTQAVDNSDEPQVPMHDGSRDVRTQPRPPAVNASQSHDTNFPLNPMADAWLPTHHRPSITEQCPDDSLLHIMQQGQLQQRQLLSAIQIPKVELMCFDGDPLKYWGFIRMFDNSMDKDTVDSCSKLSRLLQYTTGKAKRVIQCCAVMSPSDGYRRARQLLQERFGNSFVITETWINKVTNGPEIRPSDREMLQEYADELRSCSETLQAMGSIAEISSQGTLVKIIQRLPYFMQNKWRSRVFQIRKQGARNPNIHDITDFVSEVAEAANDPVYGAITDVRRRPRNEYQKETARRGMSFNTSMFGSSTEPQQGYQIPACIKCGDSHSLFGCNDFKSMRVPERIKFVADNRLCFNCLKPGHFSSDCRLARTCSVPGCNRKHTKFLHQPTYLADNTTRPSEVLPATSAAISVSEPDAVPTEARSGYTELSHAENFGATGAGVGCKGRIALPIVPVTVRAPGSDQCIQTYALLDNGSTNTFCSENLLRQLGVSGRREVLSLTTLEKAKSKAEMCVISLEVSDKENKNVLELPQVYARPVLPISLENMGQVEDASSWEHLRDVNLPMVDANHVTLLIGQDNPDALIPVDLRRGKAGEPYATKTSLGWTLNGPLGGVRVNSASVNFIQVDHDLNAQLEMFWKVEGPESLVTEKRGLSYEDKRTVAIWEESLQHLYNGHYMMAIPFRKRPTCLPPNRDMAARRLESLRKRLKQDSKLHNAYTVFMNDLLERGFAEKVNDNQIEMSDGVWYLPHHPVFNPKKPDKTRVVFDCRATHEGISLNSQVLQGPDLTNPLLGVLLRFRQDSVAIMADIEAMFHQVHVPPEDRDALRFLWWPNGDMNKDPEVYRMTVHLFSGTWSPSACNFALHRTAEDNQADFDAETVKAVLRDFYVDDCLKSLKNESKASSMVAQLCTLLQRGGFRLTKWVSNSREVMATVPEEDKAKQLKGVDLNFSVLPTERALGVCWNVESDCFCYKIVIAEKPLTKRGLLSIVSSVFDPLGFVCPYTIIAKKLIQDLTRSKIGWDEPLPTDVMDQWMAWRNGLPAMEKLMIPRCVQGPTNGEITDIQLHHFSDASQMAYGVASYLRFTDSHGHVHCCLLMAKARLAPVKQLTVPRLELTAATLAVKMDYMIRHELSQPIHSSVFWTDSMCVLQYITSEDRRFHTFVENRVATIREGSSPSQWRHVDSQSNPADDASRGLTAEELLTCTRWQNGPSFLCENETQWPKTPDLGRKVPDNDPEVKTAKICMIEQSRCISDINDLLKRRSSWYAVKKDVAWLLRFKVWFLQKYGKRPMVLSTAPLSAVETNNAEIEIVKYVQRLHFKDELEAVGSGGTHRVIKRTSTIFRLSPVLSPEGVLIVGGRLNNAPLPHDAIHQMILPKNHPMVDLVIEHMHKRLGHSGREHVLSELRQKFWIISARPTVRRVLNKCFRCKRLNAPPGEQKMAALPQNRVTPNDPPFTYVGVDYFGAFLVKRGRSNVKRYGCLFTCFTTRAMHIEVAYSLDTTSFINALQRFISRRGQPKEITSDNGTNFVGAERELREAIQGWNQTQIHESLHQSGIQWHFNPPAASHMGGVWERSIRTVRKVLRALMKEQILDDEGLATLLCMVEAIVNGRPLTAVSDDPKDLGTLTPNHLLLLRPGPVLPPGHFAKDDVYCRRRWRQIQYLANVFWRRWVKEYLPTLQCRQKWLLPRRNLTVGDIVLVVDEATSRNMWPIGRVVETFPGKDDLVRTARVETKTSLLTRPIDKLCLLEEAGQYEN